MGIDKWIFIITAFLVFDTYHDGKYSSMLLNGKKYYKMARWVYRFNIYVFKTPE